MLPALYHAHHNRHLEDLPFWLDLAAQYGDPILELGCGSGRVLVPLAQAGYRCLGLDRDLAMLKFLQSGLDPALNPKPFLIASDMRRFGLARQFPLIILPCNTFSTLKADERRASLEYVRRHLQSGGLFAASLPNPELWDGLASHSGLEFEEEFILPQTGNPVQVSSSWRRKKATIEVTWSYDQLFPDGAVERSTMRAVHWRASPDEYVDDIQSAGLGVVSIYGDFDRTLYTADSTELIILARG